MMDTGDTNLEEYYNILLRHLINVLASLKGQILQEEWMIFAEGVGIKLMGHLSSIGLLYNQGTKLRFGVNKYLDFIDNGSINVLTRAALETALAFHFIFCDGSDKKEREFRFICWDYAGFFERQGFLTISNEGIQLKKEEAKNLKELAYRINTHPSFVRFTKKQQRNILAGNWRLDQKWRDIAVHTGYSEDYFRSMYSYLCGYAHTSRLSVMQIQQAKTKEEQKSLAAGCIGYCSVIIANFLWGYSTLFPVASDAFKADQNTFIIAKMWREIGQEMDKARNMDEKDV